MGALARQQAKELPAVVPGDALIHESKVRLVDERRGLERVIRALAPQVGRGAPAKVLINQCQEPIARGDTPIVPRMEKRGDLVRGFAQ